LSDCAAGVVVAIILVLLWAMALVAAVDLNDWFHRRTKRDDRPTNTEATASRR
jgi:hypothetical protein